jgi:glycosyltransferase involved in cell wall biosynthesis
MDSLNKKRRVMIGTPCYDGRLDVWHVNSLLQTVRMSVDSNIEILPIWLSYDALIQRARNDLMALMLEMECDDIVFIDSDIEWQPEFLFKLLDYPVDVVGGTYPKKGDIEQYVAKILDMSTPRNPETGLLSVDGLGTGFLRMSRKAVDYLWNVCEPYEEKDQGKVRRLIFNVIVQNGDLVSEDIYTCMKLKEGGFDIWLDPEITCSHIGIKKYTGNFSQWFERIKNTQGRGVTANSYGVPPEIKSLYE